MPRIARLALSVPPLVKTTSLGLLPSTFAARSRASSSSGARLAPDVVHAGGIAPDLAQERQHRLAHLRVQGRGGVVIEIDRLHDAGSGVSDVGE